MAWSASRRPPYSRNPFLPPTTSPMIQTGPRSQRRLPRADQGAAQRWRFASRAFADVPAGVQFFGGVVRCHAAATR